MLGKFLLDKTRKVLKNIEMKTYKNKFISIHSWPVILFAIFIFIIFFLNIFDEIKYSEFKNTKYYLFVIIPLFYLIIILYLNFYKKITFDNKKMYLYKIFVKTKIPLYKILEINKPYILTIDKIVFLNPEDDNFWIELNEVYNKYFDNNIAFFDKTKNMYKELLFIMTEFNKGNILHKRVPGRGIVIIFATFFIWIRKLFYCSLQYKANIIMKELAVYINEYKNKPNFV